jgi:hypothetical protein
MNALKHGMTSRRDVVPGENPAELEGRFEEWFVTLVPKNPVERHLVETAVKASWKVERAERFLAARAASQFEAAPDRQRDEILGLCAKLFHSPQAPTELYGVGRYDQSQPRISWSPDGEADDPAQLVSRITATAVGCEILLGEWRTLRSRLEPGHVWLSPDKFRAVRLLGCQPTSILEVREIAEIYVASWSINPRGENAYEELKCELDDHEHKALVSRVRRRWPDMLDAGKPEEARQILIAIVDRAIAELEAKAAFHEQNAEHEAVSLADSSAFDNSPDSVRVMAYELSCSRTMLRSLSELSRLRRAAERERSRSRSGRTSEDDEDRRYREFCDNQKDWHPSLRFVDGELTPPGDEHLARQELDINTNSHAAPQQPDEQHTQPSPDRTVSPAHSEEVTAPDPQDHRQNSNNELAEEGVAHPGTHHLNEVDSPLAPAAEDSHAARERTQQVEVPPAPDQPLSSAHPHESVRPDAVQDPQFLDNEPISPENVPALEQRDGLHTHPDPDGASVPAHPDESITPSAVDNPQDLYDEPAEASAGPDVHEWNDAAAVVRAGLLPPGDLKTMIVDELRRREEDASSGDIEHRRDRRRRKHKKGKGRQNLRMPDRRIGFRTESPLLKALPPFDFSSLLDKVCQEMEDELT